MKQFKDLTILAIETSCDDTCASLVKIRGKQVPRFKIISNIISSQVEIHKKWGGIYPTLAKREHQNNLPVVFKKSIKKLGNSKIDLLSVTVGPGLEPCLWVGINFVKELKEKMKIPVIPINHLEAHIYANWLPLISTPENKIFPAIALIVSGGHTQLILMKNHGNYKILGETKDDAAGECFDKVARILNLGYPGGPIVSKWAKEFNNRSKFNLQLPRPMISQKNYDFSFSGLKTAVLYDFKSRSPKIRKSKVYIKEICNETQQSIIDVLIKKTVKAGKDYRVKTIILGGGVTANEELRKQLKNKIKEFSYKVNFLVPKTQLSTDNAAMIAVGAYFNYIRKQKNWKEIKANANLRIDEKIS